MALPHRRQQLAIFIKAWDLTVKKVAAQIDTDPIRLGNIVKGHAYPSPDEIEALSKVFDGLPIETMLDPEMLEYRHDWPPPRGVKPRKLLGGE